jgi:hypothetical protein
MTTPTLATWLTAMLMRRAERLLPQERIEWSRAMAADLHYAAEDGRALAFATGCFTSALRLRLWHLALHVPHEIAIGTIAGCMFLSHAFIPDSQSWPWIWPLAAGVATSIDCRTGRSELRRAKPRQD